MSSYKNYLVTSTLLFLLTGCNYIEPKIATNEVTINNASFKKQNTKYFNLEDEYIMYALEYESQKNYKASREIYFKLFENTNSTSLFNTIHNEQNTSSDIRYKHTLDDKSRATFEAKSIVNEKALNAKVLQKPPDDG